MEKRSIFGRIDGDGNRLHGYAAVWDSPTNITEGGRSFIEVVRRGAFSRALASGGDIIATFNHNVDRLLGRTSSGTLRLSEDDHGLRFEIDLPQSAADLKELASRGDLNGASFTFAPRKGGEVWDKGTRELRDVFLYELGPVVMPAYPATSVGLRDDAHRLRLMRLELLSRK